MELLVFLIGFIGLIFFMLSFEPQLKQQLKQYRWERAKNVRRH